MTGISGGGVPIISALLKVTARKGPWQHLGNIVQIKCERRFPHPASHWACQHHLFISPAFIKCLIRNQHLLGPWPKCYEHRTATKAGRGKMKTQAVTSEHSEWPRTGLKHIPKSSSAPSSSCGCQASPSPQCNSKAIYKFHSPL